MDENETSRLDSILENADLDDFDAFIARADKEGYGSLSEYLNVYIAKHELVLSDIVRKSQLSRDYAYAIFNGHKASPTRDRVIAICIAMGMNLQETQRALKICNAGVLYSKNDRDAAVIICINREIYDIDKVNEFLYNHSMDVLKTSKDV